MHTRIAPTPSGFLHIGNACSFLLTRQLANQYSGTVRLRIDDIDSGRTRSEYLANIFEILHLLEIEYEKGPENVYDFQENYTQLLRLPIYTALLQDLCSTGEIYACSCSRKLLIENEGQCNCRLNGLPLDTDGVAWRITVPEDTIIHFTDENLGSQQIDLSKKVPYFIVRKKDGMPAYHIASVADDLYYGTDYIVRGYDLLPTTAIQMYIAQLADRKAFINSRFFHHPLLTNAEGVKLSKSTGANSVKALLQMEKGKAQLQKLIDNWLR